MKHLLLILSFLLLPSPVIGQSSKYESVSHCFIQTMNDRELTGNKMFEMVKEECERSIGNGKKPDIEQNEVLYIRKVNGKWGYYKTGDENKDIKYVGEIKNGLPNGRGKEISPDGYKYEGEYRDGVPHGQGTETLSNGWKYVGEWREGKPWNITIYGKSGIIIMKYVNGVEQK